MCAISGFLGDHPESLLAAMNVALAHRGPDGEGLWRDPEAGVGLAHRRLAIIDLSDAAAQPMAACAGRYQVVLNGEIYNFRSFAAELAAKGYVFNPASDTAVLGPLYDLYGPAMLTRLNGIFAFAIWDARERTLFLARDRFGVKPLYYWRAPRGLVFASEAKALFAAAGLPRDIDARAARDYLTRLWSPGEHTLLQAVRKLRPGCSIRAGRDSFELNEWARPPLARAPARAAPAELAAELAQTFDAAVADHCVSDVPVGAFLSGGVDSTAVVAAMQASGQAPKRVYCIEFAGDGMAADGFEEDISYARLAADRLGLDLAPVRAEPPPADAFARLAWMLDEPQADPAPLFVEAIAAAARADGVKVLMSGAGGDDLFSGYRRHVAASLRARAGPLAALAAPLAALPAGGSALLRRASRLGGLMAGDDEDFLRGAFDFNPPAAALACLAPDVRAAAEAGDDALARAAADSRGAHLLDRLLYLERAGFLPDHNLNYTDKAAMAQGVEVRTPFLDPRLEAFASRIPADLKVRDGEAKWLLKRALAARVPRAILERPKTGFGAPVRAWVRGPLRAMLADLFAARAFRERGLFDAPAVDRLMTATLAGRQDGGYLLLALAMMELWLERAAAA